MKSVTVMLQGNENYVSKISHDVAFGIVLFFNSPIQLFVQRVGAFKSIRFKY